MKNLRKRSVETAHRHDVGEPGPAFDANAFRQALGCFPTGVALITTTDADGQSVGLTCNSFSSVSLEPPLVLWSLRLESKLLPAFRAAGSFAINVLAEDQKDLSARFASRSIIDKFEGIMHTRGTLGVPLIEACIARFECSTCAKYEMGDHLVFVGKVVRFDQARQESALVFQKGAYMALSTSLREIATSGSISPEMLWQAVVLVYGNLVRLACQSGTEEDFSAIERSVTRMAECHANGLTEERYRAGLEFFRLVALAAHNDVLAVVTDSLTTIMGHMLLPESRRYKPELVRVRWQLLSALRARDQDTAAALVEEYYRLRLPMHTMPRRMAA